MVTIFLGHDESVLNRLLYNDQKSKNFDSLILSVLSLYHLQRMLNILALIGCLYSLLIGPFVRIPRQKILAGRSYSQLFRLQTVLVFRKVFKLMLDDDWMSLIANQRARINLKTDLCSGSSFSTRGEIFLLIWSIDKYAGFNSWLYADPDNCKNFKGFSFAHQSECIKNTLKTHLRICSIYNDRNFSKIWRWVTWFERYSNHKVLSRC